MDLKVGDLKSLSLSLGYTNQSYANAKNIYLLSERGYSKLLKILEDDFAWEQYDKLVDRYFNLRNQLSSGQAPKEISAIDLFESQLLALREVESRVEEVDKKFEDLPLIGGEPEELQKTVRQVGTKALGGHGSPAYKDKSLSSKVYKNVWKFVKDQFNVNTYKAIKRKHLSKAKEIAESYTLPFYLQEEIELINSQSQMNI